MERPSISIWLRDTNDWGDYALCLEPVKELRRDREIAILAELDELPPHQQWTYAHGDFVEDELSRARWKLGHALSLCAERNSAT